VEVTRIDQIAIAVEDLDAALDHFQRAFGLVPSSRHIAADDGVEEAMLDVGGVAIQLLQATGPDTTVARFIARQGPGLHHLGFAVRSVPDALEHLREEGVRLIDEAPRLAADGSHEIAFVHPKSSFGVLVELVEETRGVDHEDIGGDVGRAGDDHKS
jgi:methylmalonyl-CoA epimerase